MMEDRDWHILQVLHEQKSITKTAQALFTSQPALTARLQQIEKDFGVKIVHRTSKGVQFTPQGEFLAKSSSEVLLQLQKIREQALNIGDAISGALRLGASSYFTMYSLPRLLKLFKQQHPHVEFKVMTTWSRDIFNLVHNREVHIGFVSSDYGWPDRKQLLFEESIYVASATAIRLEDLPGLPRIDYLTDGLIKASIDGWWREHFHQSSYIAMEVDKLATCKEMVRHGLGYAIMPDRILSDTPELRQIQLVHKDGSPVLRKSWMIYREEDLEMKALTAFVDFVSTFDFSDPHNTHYNSRQQRDET